MAYTGSLKTFMDGKGFGFISRDDGQSDVFVHVRQLTNGGLDEMKVGTRFAFDVEPDEKSGRQKAVNVTITQQGQFNDHHGDGGARFGNASGSRKGAENIGAKLFVGNLPHDIARETLEIVFSTYGRLEDVHIMTGRSKSGKSCAFVLYFSPQDAASAIAAMQSGYEIRPGEGEIIVKLAGSNKHQSYERGRDAYEDKGKGWGKDAYQDKGKGWGKDHDFNGRSSGSGFGAGGDGGGKKGSDSAGNKLYVGNLPHDITRDAIEMVFSTYGRLEDVHIMSGRAKSGNSCAFVLYANPQDAKTAIAAMQSGYEIRPGEGEIIVKLADSGKGKKGTGPPPNGGGYGLAAGGGCSHNSYSPYGGGGGGASSPLPPGWEQITDAASGKPYYCNRISGESSWTPPSAPAASPAPAASLPPGWEPVADPSSGKTYYCNRTTGQSSWEIPKI